MENLSGDASLDVFSDGFSAALSSQLGRFSRDRPELWVVAPSELKRFEDLSADAVHRTFGVDHVIAGNVRHLGSKRRVTLEFIDAAESRLLNSVVLDVDEALLASAQKEVMRAAFRLLGWPRGKAFQRALTGLEAVEDSAYADYLKGLGYLYRHDRAGNLERAVQFLDRALERDPDFVPALASLSVACALSWEYHLDEGALHAAEVRARQAQSLGDDLADSYLALGRLAFTRGRYAKAASQYEKVLARDRDHKTVRYRLAKTLDALDRHDEAEAMYRAAAKRAPYDWVGQTERADFYYRHGNYDKAEAVFRQLIRLAPQNVMGYSNLAVILYGKGALDEAEIALRQALAIQPSAWLYSTLGTLLFYSDAFNDAAHAFEQAVALRPDHHFFYGNLGDAYHALAESGRARGAYLRALELVQKKVAVNPSDHRLRSDMALYQAKLGRALAARETLTIIGEPDDMELMYKSALIHELTGDRQSAISCLTKAIESNYPLSEILKETRLRSIASGRAVCRALGEICQCRNRSILSPSFTSQERITDERFKPM